MTLICEIWDRNLQASLYLADCLAFPVDSLRERPNSSPIHLGSGWNIDTYGIDLVSKFMTGEDRLMLGSGFSDKIASIADEFISWKHGDVERLRGLLDQHYLGKPREESFIYAGEAAGKRVQSCSYCGPPIEAAHLEIHCGGMGSKYLREILTGLVPNPEHSLVQLSAEILAMLVRLEFKDYEFKNHRFGGAYEFVYLEEPGVPRRIPYGIIDLTAGEANVGDDGVNEVRSVQVKRLILAVPDEKGSVFAIVHMNGGTSRTDFFDVREQGHERPLQEGGEFLFRALKDFAPTFNIVVLRHTDVNFAVTQNLMQMTQRANGEGFEFHIDVNEVMSRMIEFVGGKSEQVWEK